MFPLKGVTLDFWETLFFDAPELDRRRDQLRCEGLRESLAKLGLNVSMDDLTRGFRDSMTLLADIWRRGEQVSTSEQIRYIVNRATNSRVRLPSDPESWRTLEQAYWSPSLTVSPTLNPEARKTLEKLHQRQLKIGLICNTGRGPGHALRELMRRESILDYFDATVFSDEIGYGKPDKRIYLATARKLGLEPAEILHVGDNIENDVGGAQSAGMKTLLFEYEVPLGFRTQPSLLVLTRASDVTAKFKPDGRVKALSEVLNFIE